MSNHIAAIHVLKSKLKLSDDDYRALLTGLTGKSSCTAMSAREQAMVRAHMDNLAARMGIPQTSARRAMTGEQFAKAKRQASPKERKVWAIWHQLHRDGKVQDNGARALDAFVRRQVHVDALRFCTDAQLNTLIESLKVWDDRRKPHGARHG